jgi:hypothetical protein
LKTISLKKFRKYLEFKGCYLKRVKSSHEIWDREKDPLDRPIVVDSNYSDVPLTHIHTCLITLGISKKDFEKEINSF